MTQAIVANFPVSSPHLPKKHKNLADKKIAGVALTELETLKHNLQMTMPLYKSFYEAKAARVHTINDKYTKVYDTTRNKIVSVHLDEGFEWVCLNGFYFSCPVLNMGQGILFSRSTGIDYVVVSDCEEDGHVVVSQKEITVDPTQEPVERKWVINTRVMAHTHIPAGVRVFDATPIASPLDVYTYFSRLYPECYINPLSEKMIADLPVSDSVTPEFGALINKKLSGSPLSSQDQENYDALKFLESYSAVFEAKNNRIHSFEDKSVKLLDYTKNGIASIVYDPIHKMEYITLNGESVLYPTLCLPNPRTVYTPFGRGAPWYTDLVIIRDVLDQNFIKIERLETFHPGHPMPVVHVHYVDLDVSKMTVIQSDPETGSGGARHYEVQLSLPIAQAKPVRLESNKIRVVE